MRLKDFERKWRKLQKQGRNEIKVVFNNGFGVGKYTIYQKERFYEKRVWNFIYLFGQNSSAFVPVDRIEDVL